MTRGIIPTFSNVIGPDGKITEPWFYYLQSLTQSLPPDGASGVIDGTAYFQPTTLFNDNFLNRPLAQPGFLFFSKDRGEIYIATDTGWRTMVPTYTGDVFNNPGDTTLILRDVIDNPGPFQNPSITVDSKGRIIAISEGSIYPIEDSGDLIVGYFNVSTSQMEQARLPRGENNQVLTVNTSNELFLEWQDSGVEEFMFAYGDATPKYLYTIKANRVIEYVQIIINYPFDDPTTTLEVGVANPGSPLSYDYDVLMSADENFPTEVGTYESSTVTTYPDDTDIYLTISPGSSTEGWGVVRIVYQKRPLP